MAVSITVSIESLVWIALDRFVAVVWPMKFHLITSRFRAFAIASTWIVALTVNSADLYLSKLRKEYGKITCSEDRNSVLFIVLGYARFVLLYFAPMVLITILYCAIAVTLRRQDKVLQCKTVHRNDHKKRKAIKMSLCVVGLFYLLFLPFLTALVFWHTPVSKSCLYEKLFPDFYLRDFSIFDNKSNHLFHICGKLSSWLKRSFQVASPQEIKNKCSKNNRQGRGNTKKDHCITRHTSESGVWPELFWRKTESKLAL